MIPNRIEAFCDLSGFAYLREYQGDMPKGSPTVTNFGGGGSGGHTLPFVVVAEEFDGSDGSVVRSWYVMTESAPDGSVLVDPFKGRCVLPSIRPAEKSTAFDPSIHSAAGKPPSFDILRQLQRARDDMLEARERHLIHAEKYLDALKRADDWRSNVENLNRVVAAKDLTIAKRDDELDALRLQIATLQASYAAMENRKSLWGRLKTWFRSTRTKWSSSRAG